MVRFVVILLISFFSTLAAVYPTSAKVAPSTAVADPTVEEGQPPKAFPGFAPKRFGRGSRPAPMSKPAGKCPWVSEIRDRRLRAMVAVTIAKESGCNPRALGSSGEIGLAQIRYEVWGSHLKKAGLIRRKADLWNPRMNVRAAGWILSNLPGSTREKFRAYNGSGKKARAYAHAQMRALERYEKEN
jgi:hypothetical protein